MPFGIPNKETPLEYHYVVKYDTETGDITLDYDTQGSAFTDGPVYDPVKKEWRQLYDHEWEEDNTAYNDAGDNLAHLIMWKLNKRLP